MTLENAIRLPIPFGLILYYIAVALTIISGIQYLYGHRKIWKENTRNTI